MATGLKPQGDPRHVESLVQIAGAHCLHRNGPPGSSANGFARPARMSTVADPRPASPSVGDVSGHGPRRPTLRHENGLSCPCRALGSVDTRHWYRESAHKLTGERPAPRIVAAS